MIFVALELKALAERHGHLCPYFALGWRVGNFFRGLLPPYSVLKDFRVLVYNKTCAVSVLRKMGFETLIEDLHEHTYVLLNPVGETLSLVTVHQDFLTPPPLFKVLEEKLLSGTATYYEKLHYAYLIDSWVVDILNASEEKMFTCETERKII